MGMIGPAEMVPLHGRRLLVVASVAMIALASMGALAVYMLSLHIASTNNAARALDARLAAKRHEVATLRQELDIRSRFVELERWGPVLGLTPAGEGQYASDVHQLDTVAAQRRQRLASVDPAPAGGRSGYTPQARKEMDSLIGDVLN
jgi:hypothetical protein